MHKAEKEEMEGNEVGGGRLMRTSGPLPCSRVPSIRSCTCGKMA